MTRLFIEQPLASPRSDNYTYILLPLEPFSWNSEYEIFFSLPMALHMTCKYLGGQQSFLFEVTWWCTFFFKILLSKAHADAINDLQYCSGKKASISKKSLKMGLKFDFWEKYKYKNRLSRKTAPKMIQKWWIFMTLSLTYIKKNFVLSWTICMTGE